MNEYQIWQIKKLNDDKIKKKSNFINYFKEVENKMKNNLLIFFFKFIEGMSTNSDK